MVKLCVNIDHVATLRQARRDIWPNPLHAAPLAEKAGAIGITVHLREDRRHIQDKDVVGLRKIVRGKLNLEMAASDPIVKIACKIKPEEATLVPEKRQELTTEGGLDVAGQKKKMLQVVQKLKAKDIVVSMFIQASEKQIKASKEVGASYVELHTGPYAHACMKKNKAEGRSECFFSLKKAKNLSLISEPVMCIL